MGLEVVMTAGPSPGDDTETDDDDDELDGNEEDTSAVVLLDVMVMSDVVTSLEGFCLT